MRKLLSSPVSMLVIIFVMFMVGALFFLAACSSEKDCPDYPAPVVVVNATVEPYVAVFNDLPIEVVVPSFPIEVTICYDTEELAALLTSYEKRYEADEVETMVKNYLKFDVQHPWTANPYTAEAFYKEKGKWECTVKFRTAGMVFYFDEITGMIR